MAQISIVANADAGIRKNLPNSNFGTVTSHAIGRIANINQIDNVTMSFNMSAIPAAAILDSASVKLYVSVKAGDHTANPRTYAVSRLLKTNWTETGVTWNNYDGINPWDTGGGDYDATYRGTLVISDNDTGVYYEIPCDDMANYWWQNGKVFHAMIHQLEIDMNDYNITAVHRESVIPELDPMLIVDYHVPGGFPVIQRLISRRRGV